MNEAVAAKLSMFRGAYKALCIMNGEEEAYAAKNADKPAPTMEWTVMPGSSG